MECSEQPRWGEWGEGVACRFLPARKGADTTSQRFARNVLRRAKDTLPAERRLLLRKVVHKCEAGPGPAQHGKR